MKSSCPSGCLAVSLGEPGCRTTISGAYRSSRDRVRGGAEAQRAILGSRDYPLIRQPQCIYSVCSRTKTSQSSSPGGLSLMRERETSQQETSGPGQGETPSIYLITGGNRAGTAHFWGPGEKVLCNCSKSSRFYLNALMCSQGHKYSCIREEALGMRETFFPLDIS